MFTTVSQNVSTKINIRVTIRSIYGLPSNLLLYNFLYFVICFGPVQNFFSLNYTVDHLPAKNIMALIQ